MPITSKKNYVKGTFTPTPTLVGGAGNTVPVYSTNTGTYTKLLNKVFCDIYLTGDGGAEGAGTGVLNLALPFTASSSNPSSYISAGIIINGTETNPCYVKIAGSATTAALAMQSDTAGAVTSALVDVTGADQNNATRTIRVQFFYEI